MGLKLGSPFQKIHIKLGWLDQILRTVDQILALEWTEGRAQETSLAAPHALARVAAPKTRTAERLMAALG